MGHDEERSSAGRRTGKDRRAGVDTRPDEQKKLTGERRSNDRRSGSDRRSKPRKPQHSAGYVFAAGSDQRKH